MHKGVLALVAVWCCSAAGAPLENRLSGRLDHSSRLADEKLEPASRSYLTDRLSGRDFPGVYLVSPGSSTSQELPVRSPQEPATRSYLTDRLLGRDFPGVYLVSPGSSTSQELPVRSPQEPATRSYLMDRLSGRDFPGVYLVSPGSSAPQELPARSPQQRSYLMDRLTGNEFPGVVVVVPASAPNQAPSTYYVSAPGPAFTVPTRGIVQTLQGYFGQAVGMVTNGASSLMPSLPITINVPDIIRGVVNRLNSGYNTVQQAWQNRPGTIFQRPQTESGVVIPPINPDAEILDPDELLDAASPIEIVAQPLRYHEKNSGKGAGIAAFDYDQDDEK